MALNFDFDDTMNLIQSQKLLLTPQLKQALDVLGMSSQELSEFAEKQMEENPVLDLYDCNNSFDRTGSESTGDGWNDTYPEEEIEDSEEAEEYESRSDFENRLTLKEYLNLQLHSLNKTRDVIEIGEYLIDNIDENGYLGTGLSDAALYYNIPVGRLLEVLELLQSFDPPGICARNPKECLLIQLRQIKCDDSDVFNIVENYLDDIAANRYTRIVRQTGMTRKRLNDILKVIRSLEPKPGREFYKCGGMKLQTPDIIVRNIDGVIKAIVNDDAFPDLNINDYYRRIKEREIEETALRFLRSRMSNALWLIKCLEQRKYIILELTEFIIRQNNHFFSKETEHYKPSSFTEAAEYLNMHESIIKKAAAGKYLHCGWGIFELAEFFI